MWHDVFNVVEDIIRGHLLPLLKPAKAKDLQLHMHCGTNAPYFRVTGLISMTLKQCPIPNKIRVIELGFSQACSRGWKEGD
jgi:hypothetical protein